MENYHGIKLVSLENEQINHFNQESLKDSKIKSLLNKQTVYDKYNDYVFSLSKNLKKKIDDLPDVLIREIFCYLLPISNTNDFFDYIRYYVWYNEFKNDYYSRESQSLNIINIRHWIPRILAIPLFTKLCIYGIPEFKIVWQQEKKENRKNFVRMKRGDSLALSLLMYRYH